MKVKLGVIVSDNFMKQFDKLSTTGAMKPQAMFALRGIRKQLVAHVEHHDEVKQKLIEKYAEKGEDKKPVTVEGPGGMTAFKLADKDGFNKEYKELCNVEVDVTEIKWSTMWKTEAPEELSPDLLYSLEFIVE